MAQQDRLSQVIDALLALSIAQVGYRSSSDTASADNAVTVWDGPDILGSDDYQGSIGLLVVGYCGPDVDQLQPSGSVQLGTGPIASTAHPRDEITTVSMLGVSQNQDTAKAARDACYAIVSMVAALCRADPSLGINSADTIGGVRTSAFVTSSEDVPIHG